MSEPLPLPNGATLLYSWDHVHAAMCIWEEMVTTTDGAWEATRENVGTVQMRAWVITILAPAAEAAWEAASSRAEAEDYDPGSYDWDFVPIWLRMCVDWSGDQPVVRSTVPEPAS